MTSARSATEPAPAAPSPWLIPAEVAQIARCCTDTVWDALKAGELHGHRKNSRGPWTVHKDSVTAWIEADDPAVAAISSARMCSCGKLRILRPA
jgi:Helix-turn-helix domain